jgi:hypothetical protein
MNVWMRLDVPGALELPGKPSSTRRRNQCPFALLRQNSVRTQWVVRPGSNTSRIADLNASWMSAFWWMKITAFAADGIAVHDSNYEVPLEMLFRMSVRSPFLDVDTYPAASPTCSFASILNASVMTYTSHRTHAYAIRRHIIVRLSRSTFLEDVAEGQSWDEGGGFTAELKVCKAMFMQNRTSLISTCSMYHKCTTRQICRSPDPSVTTSVCPNKNSQQTYYEPDHMCKQVRTFPFRCISQFDCPCGHLTY